MGCGGRDKFIYLFVSVGDLDLIELRTPSTQRPAKPVLQAILHARFNDLRFAGEKFFQNFMSSSSRDRTRLLRKWIPVCLSIDYEGQLAQVAVNGHISEKVEPDKPNRRQDKYGGDLMIEDMQNSANNFTVIVARYFFDKKRIVGKMVGINAWNRTLSVEELSMYTNCKNITIPEGNRINKDTSWHYNGGLLSDFEVDTEDMICTELRKNIHAFLPIPGLSHSEAVDLCHKFGADIDIGAEFTNEAEYSTYYNLVWSESSRRFREEDFYGNTGRLRVASPYIIKDVNGTNKAMHHVSGREVGVDFWFSNHGDLDHYAKMGRTVMSSYMGLVPYKENFFWMQSSEKRSSTSCHLYNSFEKTTTVNIRGLCRQSFIDKIYMVEYTKYVKLLSTLEYADMI